MEPFWNRRRVILVLLVLVLPTLVAGLLGGRFWAGTVGLFAVGAFIVMWIYKDDSEELQRGEFATDRNRRRRSFRLPFGG